MTKPRGKGKWGGSACNEVGGFSVTPPNLKSCRGRRYLTINFNIIEGNDIGHYSLILLIAAGKIT